MTKRRVVRDPVYGYVTLTESLTPVAGHPLVQRLRRVGQTSLTSSVYPSATGGRFEHALGTMHLARLSWQAIVANSDDRAITLLRKAIHAEVRAEAGAMPSLQDPDTFLAVTEDAMAAAGLLHDLGHPPFSHVLEPFFARMAVGWLDREAQERWDHVWAGQFHEAAGALLAREVLERFPQDRRVLTELILDADPDEHTDGVSVLHAVIASEIDIDRIDYLMRDAQRAGTEFGAIDYQRLIDALEIRPVSGGFRVAPNARARSAVETLLIQRTQSYKWITFHHRVAGTNGALTRAVELIDELGQESSEIELLGEDVPLGQVIARLRPNLNYLAPSLVDLGLRTRTDLGRLSSQRERAVVDRVSDLLRAGVDDATVLEWLKSSATSARLILGEASRLAPDSKERLEHLVAFTDIVLVRARRLVAAWKTVDEFEQLTARLVEHREQGSMSLGEEIVTVCDEVLGTLRGDAADRVRAYRQTLEGMLLGSSAARMVGVNLLIEIFLSSRTWRRELESDLQVRASSVQDRRGVWATEYTGFRAIRTKGQLASLWQPAALEPAALRETSPLVAALADAEASRPRLYAYFILLDGEPGEQPGLLDVELRLVFTVAFAAFLRRRWRPFLEELAED